MNDYKYSLHTPGLYYTNLPTFVDNDSLADYKGFSSLYSVDARTAEALQQAGTAGSFKGVVWSERLWLDVDTKGLSPEEAVNKLHLVETVLKTMEVDYVAYDSGGNPVIGGGHFGILRSNPPSHLLPAQDREWAKKHFGAVADLSIYTHLHLFRLPGTVHEVTGRSKSVVSRQSGKSLTLPPLSKSVPVLDAPFEVEGARKSIFSNFNIMNNIGPQRNGERHLALVRLAFELKEHGVGPNQALWILQENNLLFQEPKGQEELEKIVKDIYGKEA